MGFSYYLSAYFPLLLFRSTYLSNPIWAENNGYFISAFIEDLLFIENFWRIY